MKKMFEVRIQTHAQLLPAFIELISGEATLVSVTEVPASPLTTKGKIRQRHHYTNAKKDKGISGEDLAIELLSNGPMPYEKMALAFGARGFAPATASAILSIMKKEGKAENQGHGIWSLIKKAGKGS